MLPVGETVLFAQQGRKNWSGADRESLTIHFFTLGCVSSKDQAGGWTMRSLIALTTAAALVIAGIPVVPSYGESAVPPARVAAAKPNLAVVELFKAFPQGGE